MIFTAKHGGGYAMYDSRYTRWNAFRTGPRRDFVRELSEACTRAGLRFPYLLFSGLTPKFSEVLDPEVFIQPDD